MNHARYILEAVGIVTDETTQEKFVTVTGGFIGGAYLKSTEILIDGTWSLGEDIVGPSATRALRIINTDDTVTAFADNDNIETEADSILDFSETNPFGTP